jgi:hypothetical protein
MVNGHHWRPLDIESQSVETLRQARSNFAEQDTRDNAQHHPQAEKTLKNTSHFSGIVQHRLIVHGRLLLLIHTYIEILTLTSKF